MDKELQDRRERLKDAFLWYVNSRIIRDGYEASDTLRHFWNFIDNDPKRGEKLKACIEK